MSSAANQRPDRAIIYLRESDIRMIKSLGSQRTSCRAYCGDHSYVVVAELQDIKSGDSLWEREAMTQARALIRDGGADVLVLNDNFRLSRNMNHRIYLREELLHYGCRVEYVTTSEEDTKEGDLLAVIRDYAGDIEREKIIERSTRGRRHRAAQRKVLLVVWSSTVTSGATRSPF
jgi:site-specific DNA recombinase